MTTTRNPKTHALRTSAAVAIAAAAVLTALPALAQAPAGIPGVVAPGVEPELVQEGFVFTEGPVGTPDGGLYFSDIRPNKIYHLGPDGKIVLVREQTNGANGLAVTKDGDLLAAEGEDLADVLSVVGHYHRLREKPVGAGVGGVADEVSWPREHAIGAEQRLQFAAQRLRGAGRQRVGSAVRSCGGHD